MQWHLKKFDELDGHTLYRILKLRIDVFMLEQQCLYPECDDKDLLAQHLFLEEKGGLLAYARLIPPGISYTTCSSIGRVLVHQGYRSTGLGKDLVHRAIAELIAEYPGVSIRISAQQYLESFYIDLGFVTESDVYLEDDIPHLEMTLYPDKR